MELVAKRECLECLDDVDEEEEDDDDEDDDEEEDEEEERDVILNKVLESIGMNVML